MYLNLVKFFILNSKMEKNPILFRKLGVLVVKKSALILLKIGSYEVQMI